jgi:hypothetical protein
MAVVNGSVLLALLAGSLLVGSSAVSAEAACGSGQSQAATSSEGPWTLITPPLEGSLVSYAVAADRPEIMLVTDGVVVHRSVDAGRCWDVVYTLGYLGGRVPSTPAVDAISELGVDATGTVMFAAVSPCKTRRPAPGLPGCTVLVSGDGGNSWSERASGFPLTISSVDTLLVSDRGATAYVAVTDSLTGTQLLYGTDDAGIAWTLRSGVATKVLAIDPTEPRAVWAGGLALSQSTDGGRTWHVADSAPTGVLSLSVQHRSSQAVLYLAQVGQSLRSSDNGRTWSEMTSHGQPVGGFTGMAQLQDGMVTAVADFPRDAWTWRHDHGWRELARGPTELSDVTADRANVPSFYFRESSSVIVRYTPGAGPGAPGGDDTYSPENPQNRAHPPIRNCYQGDGNIDPSQLNAPVQQAPLGTVVYVTNTDTGCVVAFDHNGKSRVLFQAPTHTEGLAVGFDGQLTIATRTSNQVVRTRFPVTDSFSRIGNVQSNEGPSFDQRGNLFVANNSGFDKNEIYELPYPQRPLPPLRAPQPAARVIWAFGEGQFVEDTRIAPASSPFAGSLLVMHGVAHSAPNAIAILKRQGTRWTRIRDFGALPFLSLGMAFEPDGSVLVPEFGGGRIARISRDGTTTTTFADLGPSYMFTKIDVTAAGYVYATSTFEGEAGIRGAPGLRPGRNVVVRFDPAGRRMLPDFSANLSYPCGVAVANVITGHPLLRPPLLQPPPAGVNPPPADPPPPVQAPQPQVQPGPVSAPVPAPAPAPAPAAQPQANPVSQANPVAQSVPQVGLVPQKQTQAQLATVQVQAEPAAQRNEYLMSRRQRSQPIPAPAALLAVGFVACCLQTRAWLVSPRHSHARNAANR